MVAIGPGAVLGAGYRLVRLLAQLPDSELLAQVLGSISLVVYNLFLFPYRVRPGVCFCQSKTGVLSRQALVIWWCLGRQHKERVQWH